MIVEKVLADIDDKLMVAETKYMNNIHLTDTDLATAGTLGTQLVKQVKETQKKSNAVRSWAKVPERTA